MLGKNNDYDNTQNIVALEIRVNSRKEKEWLCSGFNSLIRTAKFHSGKDVAKSTVDDNYVHYNNYNDESTVNARFRSLSSNIEQIVAPQNKRNGKSQSIGDDQNQWTNIELQRQLELANIMLEEEAMDQNLIESTEALLNYIKNVYEKSISKSIDEATFYTRDGISARNNTTLRNVPKRYKRVNMLLLIAPGSIPR